MLGLMCRHSDSWRRTKGKLGQSWTGYQSFRGWHRDRQLCAHFRITVGESPRTDCEVNVGDTSWVCVISWSWNVCLCNCLLLVLRTLLHPYGKLQVGSHNKSCQWMQTKKDSTHLLTYRSHSHLPVVNWAASTVAYPINMSLVVHVFIAFNYEIISVRLLIGQSVPHLLPYLQT